jgi:Tfp pilus assembly protein FimT
VIVEAHADDIAAAVQTTRSRVIQMQQPRDRVKSRVDRWCALLMADSYES